MTILLQKLCELYVRDFDLVFQQGSDPVDLFCQQHDARDQRAWLGQVKGFHKEVLLGKKSIKDLRKMGLEYVPDDEPDPATWLPLPVGHLEGKMPRS